MIVMTLGTASFQFDRAITWLSLLLEREVISEPVFVQYGISDISVVAQHPLVTAEPMVESRRLMALVNAAKLVISHAGQGSTRMLAAQGASFVLLPRLKKYAEHIDDHQLWFAQAVEELGVQYCLSLRDLEQVIVQPPPRFQQQLFSGPKLADHLLAVHPLETLTALST
jgi:UDP-N-acetylglucosamine transferase subunit ALG13